MRDRRTVLLRLHELGLRPHIGEAGSFALYVALNEAIEAHVRGRIHMPGHGGPLTVAIPASKPAYGLTHHRDDIERHAHEFLEAGAENPVVAENRRVLELGGIGDH